MLKHDCVGGVRGTGLFIGFELVTDQVSKTPNKALALDLIEMLRVEYLVLTSVAGPHGNVIKLRPSLAFQVHDIDWLVGALDQSLQKLIQYYKVNELP